MKLMIDSGLDFFSCRSSKGEKGKRGRRRRRGRSERAMPGNGEFLLSVLEHRGVIITTAVQSGMLFQPRAMEFLFSFLFHYLAIRQKINI
jgi:hypothetical protein